MRRSICETGKRVGIVLVGIAGVLGASSCRLPSDAAWTEINEGRWVPMERPGSRGHLATSDGVVGDSPRTNHRYTSGVVTEGAGGAVYPSIQTRPIGAPVPGKTGYVYSPHMAGQKQVDVRRFRAGQEVLCPYTMRSFIVPDFRQISRAPVMVAQKLIPVTEDPSVAQVATTGRVEIPVVRSEDVNVETGPAFGNSDSEIDDNTEKSDAGTAYGIWVEDRPGFITSPYAKVYQLVDVTGIAPGTPVRCPYSGKLFLVPLPPGVEKADRGEAAGRETVEKTQTTLPTAAWENGHPGYVQSPFGEPGQLVNVVGRKSGAEMTCPFTGQKFLVPEAE